MRTASAQTHMDAVIAKVDGAVDFFVGDGEAPKEPRPDKYVVFYGQEGGRNTGSLEEPFEDAEIPIQATCVGKSRKQADWVRDRVVEILCDGEGLDVEDRVVVLVTPEGQPRRFRDDDVSRPYFITAQRLTLLSTPE